MKRIFTFRLSVVVAQLAVMALVMILAIQCKDPEITSTTTDDVVITGYFEKHPEEFSEFLRILQITGNSGFLGAYGTYTCFAPTNEAVAHYLQSKDVSSVEQISVDELKTLVRFHVIQDTLSTSSFTDGKLSRPTMYGQYLITGAVNIEGTSYIRVNRQANIIQSNIHTANGLIHVVDDVMTPALFTLAETIEQNDDYSIFLQALQETGYYDTLNTIKTDPKTGERRWFTVVAQKDEVFHDAGFDTYADVKAHYSQTGDPKNHEDSLFLFVSYRILPDIKYLADLITAPSHPTLAPLEVITTRLDGTDVLVNSDVFNGVQEPGVMLDRNTSDFSATNGVLHSTLGNYTIKIRVPFPVYWDVADQPELRRMTNDFRKPGKTVVIPLGMLGDVTWGGSSTNTISYQTNAATSTDQFVYADRLTMSIRTGVIPWIEFNTPLIVKGRYKVWMCYRRVNTNDMQAFFDGTPLPRIFGLNPTPGYPAVSESEAEAQGWKLYTAGGDNRWVARLLGTVDVATTDRHKFKVVGLTNRGGSTGNAFWMDMVHFIPVDKDQVYPKFAIDGTQVPRP